MAPFYETPEQESSPNLLFGVAVSSDDIFVDTGVAIYGSRREWVSKNEVEKIDELGEPYPMAELELGDFRTYRWLTCPRYDRCLDYAKNRNWNGFSCSRCRHCQVEVEEVPDDPGIGYRKDDFGRWFIPRNFRFHNRSSKVCECGARKDSPDDDMCAECEVELEAIFRQWYD